MRQPSRNEEIEAVRESWQVIREWIMAYNRADTAGQSDRAHFPMINFGGAELCRDVLDIEVREGPSDMPDRPRDPPWNHSIIDRWAVHQHSERKAHVVIDFRRCRSNGSPYGVALSRLSVVIKEDGQWGVRAQSSCGLRNPERVQHDDDAEVSAAAEGVVRDLFEAINAKDSAAASDLLHDPFFVFSGTDLAIYDDPKDYSLVPSSESRWARSSLVSFEVLPPQSGDKAVIDLNVRRYDENGSELQPEGAIYLVTRVDGEWGVSLTSKREGVSGVP